MTSPNPERLFLAVDLAEELRRALEAHLRGRDLPGRAVAPASWHLTLRFLGDTLPEERARLAGEMRAAALGAPFTLGFDRAGAFPRPARAAVLWLGVAEGEAPLRALAAEAEDAAFRETMPVEEVVLFRSLLGAGGARYEALERFPLRR